MAACENIIENFVFHAAAHCQGSGLFLYLWHVSESRISSEHVSICVSILSVYMFFVLQHKQCASISTMAFEPEHRVFLKNLHYDVKKWVAWQHLKTSMCNN